MKAERPLAARSIVRERPERNAIETRRADDARGEAEQAELALSVGSEILAASLRRARPVLHRHGQSADGPPKDRFRDGRVVLVHDQKLDRRRRRPEPEDAGRRLGFVGGHVDRLEREHTPATEDREQVAPGRDGAEVELARARRRFRALDVVAARVDVQADRHVRQRRSELVDDDAGQPVSLLELDLDLGALRRRPDFLHHGSRVPLERDVDVEGLVEEIPDAELSFAVGRRRRGEPPPLRPLRLERPRERDLRAGEDLTGLLVAHGAADRARGQEDVVIDLRGSRLDLEILREGEPVFGRGREEPDRLSRGPDDEMVAPDVVRLALDGLVFRSRHDRRHRGPGHAVLAPPYVTGHANRSEREFDFHDFSARDGRGLLVVDLPVVAALDRDRPGLEVGEHEGGRGIRRERLRARASRARLLR